MSNMTASIREDYDHEADPVYESEEMKNDISELETLANEMHTLEELHKNVSVFGMSATTVHFLKNTLLSGTSLDAIAVESYNDNDTNQTVALEAIVDKVKETASKWSAKIVSFFSKIKASFESSVLPLLAKLKDKASDLKEKFDDSATGKFVKAHPYVSFIAAATAISTIAAVISFYHTGVPKAAFTDKTASTFLSKIKDMLDKVKLPFGKVKTTYMADGQRFTAEVIMDSAVKGDTVGKLGWTKNAIGNALSHVTESISNSWKFVSGVMRKPHDTGVMVGRIVHHGTNDAAIGAKMTALTTAKVSLIYFSLLALYARVVKFVVKLLWGAISAVAELFTRKR